MTHIFTESVVEEAALAWLAALSYTVLHGPDIAAGQPAAERSDEQTCSSPPEWHGAPPQCPCFLLY